MVRNQGGRQKVKTLLRGRRRNFEDSQWHRHSLDRHSQEGLGELSFEVHKLLMNKEKGRKKASGFNAS